MPKPTSTERLQILEQKVDLLETLPSRVTAVEVQILQLREEMRGEFSTVRSEIRAGDDETRRYARELHEIMLARIEADNAETRRHMRVLHEEVLARIATLQEGRRRRK